MPTLMHIIPLILILYALSDFAKFFESSPMLTFLLIYIISNLICCFCDAYVVYGLTAKKFKFEVTTVQGENYLNEIDEAGSPVRQYAKDSEDLNLFRQKRRNLDLVNGQNQLQENKEEVLERRYTESTLVHMIERQEAENRDNENIYLRRSSQNARSNQNAYQFCQRRQHKKNQLLSHNSGIADSNNPYHPRYDENDVYEVIAYNRSNIDGCNICLDTLSNPKLQIARIKCECQNIFHLKCLDQWLKSNSTCPACRKKVEKIESFRKQAYPNVYLPSESMIYDGDASFGEEGQQ